MNFLDKIRKAAEVVEESGVPKELREVAFDNVLRVMLNNEVRVDEVMQIHSADDSHLDSHKNRGKLHTYCRDLGLNEDLIDELYMVRDDQVHLTINELRLPDGTKERLITVSLVAMFIRQGIEHDVETSQKVLSEYAEQYKAKDSNFSRHLSALGTWCQVAKSEGVRSFTLKKSGWQEAAARIQALVE